MEGVKGVKVGADGFGALHMQDAGDDACGHVGADLGHAGDEFEAALGRTLHPQHVAGHGHGGGHGLGGGDEGGQGHPEGRVFHQLHVVDAVVIMRGGDVDGEKSACKAAFGHAGQVKVTAAFAGQPNRLAVLWGVKKAQEDVVVAVEGGEHVGAFDTLGEWRGSGGSHPPD